MTVHAVDKLELTLDTPALCSNLGNRVCVSTPTNRPSSQRHSIVPMIRHSARSSALRICPLRVQPDGLIAGAALALLAAGAIAQTAPTAAAPPIPAVTQTSPSTIVRYDEKCLALAVQACLGDVTSALRTAKHNYACPGESWRGKTWKAELVPRTDSDDKPCLATEILSSVYVAECRYTVQLFPPESCERTELTESGWRATLRAEFAAIAEELKRACRAAGKSEAECAHPAAALPLAPVKPVDPVPAPKTAATQ